jgi:hypothetical protein
MDPTLAFFMGVSVGELVSLALVTGSIKFGEMKAIKRLLENKSSRRRPTTKK